MEAIAKLKKIPISSRKIRLLADLIRGIDVKKALAVLKHEPKKCTFSLEKLVRSAVANWKYANDTVETADLCIKKITVDNAGMLKRFRPASRGRMNRIRKRFSHVSIVVDQYARVEKKKQGESIQNIQNTL